MENHKWINLENLNLKNAQTIEDKTGIGIKTFLEIVKVLKSFSYRSEQVLKQIKEEK